MDVPICVPCSAAASGECEACGVEDPLTTMVICSIHDELVCGSCTYWQPVADKLLPVCCNCIGVAMEVHPCGMAATAASTPMSLPAADQRFGGIRTQIQEQSQHLHNIESRLEYKFGVIEGRLDSLSTLMDIDVIEVMEHQRVDTANLAQQQKETASSLERIEAALLHFVPPGTSSTAGAVFPSSPS